MSKKLAVSPTGLVICVGSGSGAYMATTDQARELATAMAAVGAGAGVPSVMLLTDLDCVLGTTVGNAVGVVETVDFLTGRERDPRVLELVLEIVAEMALLAGVVTDLAEGRALAQARLDDGSGADRFGRMIAALGGPADFVADPARYLPGAAVERPVLPAVAGYVAGMDAKAIGLALVALGGGRKRPDEVIDFGVGITHVAGVGAAVGPDTPLCVVKARTDAEWEAAAARIRAAVRVTQSAPAPLASIIKEKLRRSPA
jgi:thymidine phosphorylase